MIKKAFMVLVLLSVSIGLLFLGTSFSDVVKEKGKTFIIDQTGEPWDVTQAESIGFDPHGFQYGIGRNAFTPLDDSDLSDDKSSVSPNNRVIGVRNGLDAHAYAIDKLRRHEIANTRLGSKPIATGY